MLESHRDEQGRSGAPSCSGFRLARAFAIIPPPGSGRVAVETGAFAMSTTTTMRIVRLGLAFVAGASIVVTALPAEAQQRKERKTILELLFGKPKREEAAPERQIKKPRTVNRKKKQTTTIATKPEPAAIEKLPDAKVVLVVGDFIAGSLGEGLVAAFESTPGIIVERRTNGSSGIIREDYYNWRSARKAQSRKRARPRRAQHGRQRPAADGGGRREGKVPFRGLDKGI
ncbi:MAG: hypothetical protein M9905_06565 [Rhizobiaceae bacterium]|nr:hypothetical protein [Rhizobiaceae bacterium]